EKVRSPAELMPISVCLVSLRGFHKILAERISSILCISEFQAGFSESDGVARKLTILEKLFISSKKSLKSIRVVSLDLNKDFDTVSHEAISHVLKSCAPSGFC